MKSLVDQSESKKKSGFESRNLQTGLLQIEYVTGGSFREEKRLRGRIVSGAGPSPVFEGGELAYHDVVNIN